MANTVKDFAAPDGPILLLSAKGLTTAGIAEANGVKDFSGNSNHGTASGGIGVTNDSEMGSCFDFTDLSAVQSINGAFQNPSSSLTLSIRYKRTGSIAQRNQLLIGDADSSNVCRLSIYITTRTDPDLVTVAKYSNSDNDPLTCNINTTLGKTTSDVHLYTVTYDAGASLLSLYIDDTLAATKTVPVQTFTVSKFMLGYPTASYRPVGLISEARIYPRALSAAEVKYLYNGFQPNIIVGQAIPSGAILDLSARGLTTAGIAQANGVVDRSGNMNAGTAYGGISIVNDSSLGECFSFDGSDDYMEFNKSSFMDAFSNIQGLTVAFKMKPNNVSGKEIVLFEGFYDEATTLFAIRLYQGKINYYVRRRISDSWVTYSSSLSITQDGVYRVAVLFDWQNEKVSLYIEGTLDSTYDTSFGAGGLLNSPTFIWLGKHSKVNRCYRGLLTDVLVYPRVLTTSEIRQLADASLKKVTAVRKGSSEVQRVYYGSNLAYAKTAKHTMTISNNFVRKQLSKTTMGSNSRCVFVSPEGNMFATDWSGKRVKIFDSTGAYITYFIPLSGKIPYAIAGDATYLYVCYWDSTNIYKYQYSGTSVPTLISTWTAPVTQNDGAIVYNGDLYVVSQQKKIFKINTSTGTVTTLVNADYSVNAIGIDTKNNRIVTVQNGGLTPQYTTDYNARIIAYNMSGVALKTTELNGSYTSSVNGPQGMVVDADGTIYLGGAYSTQGQYNQGLLVLNDSHNIIYDISYQECPTFCYSFCYDIYHNRIVWIGSGYGASPYIFGISIPPVYSLTIE